MATDPSKYGVKLEAIINANSGALVVTETRDGNPYRSYSYDYQDFYLPGGTGVDVQGIFTGLVAMVRKAMINLGHPDEDSSPTVAKFSNLSFARRVAFDQFLMYLSGQLHTYQLNLSYQYGYNRSEVVAAWQAAVNNPN